MVKAFWRYWQNVCWKHKIVLTKTTALNKQMKYFLFEIVKCKIEESETRSEFITRYDTSTDTMYTHAKHIYTKQKRSVCIEISQRKLCCFRKMSAWRMEIDRVLRKHLKCDQRVPLVNYDFHLNPLWPFPLNFGHVISSLSKFNNTLVGCLNWIQNKIWQTHQQRLINVYLVCL